MENVLRAERDALVRQVWVKPGQSVAAKDLLVEYGGEGRKFVRPGEYKLTLTCGKAKHEQRLKVEIAPGIETR